MDALLACQHIKFKLGNFRPELAIVLGTGLTEVEHLVEVEAIMPYSEIPGFPISTVQGHAGKMLFGHIGSRKVVLMSGRIHYYEGYSMEQVTFPIRVFKQLGVKSIILTNASGGLNPDFQSGDLVLIKDHINFQPENPLRGPNDERLGLRFPDMTNAYDPDWMLKAERMAESLGIDLKKGVYIAVQGPNFETPAENRFFRAIGADMVGMSTVPEVIVAVHAGIKVCAISVVANPGNMTNDKSLDTTMEEVLANVSAASRNLARLIEGMV